jgi:hypothetical protein
MMTGRCQRRRKWLGAKLFQILTEYYTPRRELFGMLGAASIHIPRTKAVTEPSTSADPQAAPPPLVASFFDATNNLDVERLLATFAEDALVNDQLRDYWGKPAIRQWAERDLVGEKLTIKVTKVVNHYGNCIVTADVDGNFDRRGLPDPLVLAFYFTTHSDLLVQLIILRNRYDI